MRLVCASLLWTQPRASHAASTPQAVAELINQEWRGPGPGERYGQPAHKGGGRVGRGGGQLGAWEKGGGRHWQTGEDLPGELSRKECSIVMHCDTAADKQCHDAVASSSTAFAVQTCAAVADPL